MLSQIKRTGLAPVLLSYLFIMPLMRFCRLAAYDLRIDQFVCHRLRTQDPNGVSRRDHGVDVRRGDGQAAALQA